MKSLRSRRVRAPRLSVALRPLCAAAAFSVSIAASTRAQAADAKSGIVINIDGRNVEAPAILQSGAVLVPLRGVLENLGARVAYDAAEKRIDIFKDGKKTQLRIGQDTAISDVKSIKLTAPPQIIDKTTFVPLRSLAELFGYEVRWLGAQKTVAISSGTAPKFYADHRKALEDAGALGVIIDFSDASTDDADKLLDAAKNSGVTLIKTRFDWNTLEPSKGAAFQWPIYDHVVKGARERGLILVGILGDSAKWASMFSDSNNIEEWRSGAPRDNALPAWSNYVQRVVGRYKNDVQAWQIWDRPSSDRFRAGRKTYRSVVRLASVAARGSDSKAILLAGEPGGVNLDFIGSLNANGVAKLVDGLELYPTAQYQPGAPASPEEFVRPYNLLRLDNSAKIWGASNLSARDFWVGGLSWPVLGENGAAGLDAADAATRARLTRTFTPQAQADYLVRASTLALAAGAPKVFWDTLRDAASYERVEPFNPDFNGGLLRRDFTPRLSFAALQTLAKLTRGKTFIGTLSADASATALVFSSGDEAEVVAWGDGSRQMAVNSSGADPKIGDALYVSTRPTARVLASSGDDLGGADGVIPLTPRPVWVTGVAYESVNAAKARKKDELLQLDARPSGAVGDTVSAQFSQDGAENGLSWRKFANFRSEANRFVKSPDGREGLQTEVSTDIYNPAAGRYYIFLDVDDNFLYFNQGTPLRVTVQVKRPASLGDTLVNSSAGFNIQYDAPGGAQATPFQIVEPGDGWATYSFDIPDALLINSGGADFVINTFGSKRGLVFGGVTIQKLPKP